MQQQQTSPTRVSTETATATLVDIPAEGVLTLVPVETSSRGGEMTLTAEATAAADASAPHVTFHESIIDNEHLGKKKSKICCIYRRPYDPNASSSDETTSEEDNNEEDEAQKARKEANIGNSYDVMPKRKKKNRHHHAHCSH